MDAARIAELLRPYVVRAFSESSRGCDEAAILSPEQLRRISTYIDLLLRWNSRVNLTAIRNEEEIVTRHFGESLFAARHLFPGHVRADGGGGPLVKPRLADLGSGAGFPGIPIKLWAPEISVTLIESNQKKAAFLREAIRALTLTDIDVRNVRAETLNETFDFVALRAVERFAEILPVALRLVSPKGRLALLVGSSQAEGIRLELTSMSWGRHFPIPGSKSRVLLVGSRR